MRRCFSLRCVGFLTLIVATLTTVATLYVILKVAFPMRRAFYLEQGYRYKLWSNKMYDIAWSWHKSYNLRESRLRPLIEDVPQLHYWPTNLDEKVYDDLLTLNFDGTGWYPGREYWIYIAGTSAGDEAGLASDSSSNATGACTSDESCEELRERERHATVFSHPYKQHACVNPPHVCNEFNAAFNRVAARWHGVKAPPTNPELAKIHLRFADCDITPLFCNDLWGLGADPVMLVHLEIGEDCEDSMGIERCSATWRFISLPLYNMPWTRQIRVSLDGGGSTVVPAFPDAEEQLWSLISHPGAEDAIYYTDEPEEDRPWNTIITVEPVEGETPKVSAALGLIIWAGFRSHMDNPYSLPEWPYEAFLKCSIGRWMDILLIWWDGQLGVVEPDFCDGFDEDYR